LQPFDFQLTTRLVFGPGTVSRLGDEARELGFNRPLLVADHGLQAAGHVDRAIAELMSAGVDAVPFHDFDINPDTKMVERGTEYAKPLAIDSIIGLADKVPLLIENPTSPQNRRVSIVLLREKFEIKKKTPPKPPRVL